MPEMYKNKDGKVVVLPTKEHLSRGGKYAGPEYQAGGSKAKGFAAATPEQRSAWGRKGGSKGAKDV